MGEINCDNCLSACCRGNEVVALSLEEVSFMMRGGTKLLLVAFPVNYDREDIPYPLGTQIDTVTGETSFFYEPGRETEPLAANLGRYVMASDCGYLRTGSNGRPYCGAYDERPQMCQDFEMGGDTCKTMRQRVGIDDEIEGVQVVIMKKPGNRQKRRKAQSNRGK